MSVNKDWNLTMKMIIATAAALAILCGLQTSGYITQEMPDIEPVHTTYIDPLTGELRTDMLSPKKPRFSCMGGICGGGFGYECVVSTGCACRQPNYPNPGMCG